MNLAEGAVLPTLTVTFSRETLVRYAGASTDFNPIHLSDEAARAIGLPGIVAHGMLTMGTALRVVTDVIDPARLRSYYVRFTKPVVVDPETGATLEFSGQVTKVEDGVATVAIQASCANEAVLGSAVAEVLVD